MAVEASVPDLVDPNDPNATVPMPAYLYAWFDREYDILLERWRDEQQKP